MKSILGFVLQAMSSKWATAVVVCFCVFSLFLGQHKNDMNLFAASGGIMTVFGLLSLMRFTTIKKYVDEDELVAKSSGLTSGPLSDEEAALLAAKNIAAAKIRLRVELASELNGLALTVLGTIIWAYGVYLPIIN